IVLLTADEAIKGVPARMREAAIGMGATPTQVVTKVVVPTAAPAMLTGVMLAVARAAGETAPLLFTALFSQYWISARHPYFLPKTMADLMKPTASLAVMIYNFSSSPFENQITLAWTAALVLVVLVLVFNVIGQALAGRSAD
ncbi:MAG: ABC transporter permease subunit, partial [Deltaproteobacteria bacterium]|nr:ABC transporter permease subunit [Deltaproteobacteria bacterium]